MVSQKQTGFLLIEAIIFIVVIGIVVFSILAQLKLVSENSHDIQSKSVAAEVANKCIQWYIGSRYMNGYSTITCPSTTTPSFCSAPSGYNVAVNVSCISKYSSPTTAYKSITVSVSGKATAGSSVILADY